MFVSSRWLTLRDGALISSIRSPKHETPEEVIIPDLRIATPKATTTDVSDRQYCFELISPVGTLKLQAASALQRDLWISGITVGS